MKQHSYISTVKRKWTSRVILKIVAAAAISITSFSILMLSLGSVISLVWLVGFALLSTGLAFLIFKNQFPTWEQVKKLINQQTPEIEYSISILDEETSGLAELQQERVLERLTKSKKTYRFPVKFHETAYFLVVGLAIILVTLLTYSEQSNNLLEVDKIGIGESDVSSEKDSTHYNWKLTAQYPSYTNLKSQKLTSLNIEKLPEGSLLTWSLEFNNPIFSAWMTFSNGDSLALSGEAQSFKLKRRAVEKGFYQIIWQDSSGIYASEYYRLMTLPDSPPEVNITDIPQYQKIPIGEQQSLNFTAKAVDNYGLQDAFITATVTKGSGESVKFREVIIPFLKKVSGKTFEEKVTFTIDQFDLEPGNELYFYLTAKDNHMPPQLSKTETYFFILEDTTEIVFSLEGDLGINQMPEYFRSQRQIIIDSEKLLVERSKISKEEFNQRSNELGFDQKALRLKYGQFLGEESESGAAIENEVEDEPDVSIPGEVDVLSEFGHDHDHENEEGQHMDKGTEHADHHDHDHAEEEEDIVEQLSHTHDNMEEATFFEASLKSKLRGALSEMWDAELHLRLYDPKQSLPYQYKALELIKEIKNHARIYVQRTGFDPPPINEAKSRLTGDLDEITPKRNRTINEPEEVMPGIKELIISIDQILIAAFPVSNQLKAKTLTAGNEIAKLAIDEPGKYLGLLSNIKSMAEVDSFDNADELIDIKYRLLSVLEKKQAQPVLQNRVNHPLMDQFIEEILKSE